MIRLVLEIEGGERWEISEGPHVEIGELGIKVRDLDAIGRRTGEWTFIPWARVLRLHRKRRRR